MPAMRTSRPDARIDNLLGWFAASAVVTAATVYVLKFEADARKVRPGFVNPTPAQEPLALQEARAGQGGRGRRAKVPTAIPWRGWKDILTRAYSEIQNDRVLALAAGVVFYSLVALVPAIAAGVSSYALFADAATIASHLSLLANIIPGNALDIMSTEITRIAAASNGKLSFGFLVGLAIALWSANAGMKAIFDALNVIYDETEKRGFVSLNLQSLLFTLCGIAGALLAGSAVVVFPLALAAIGFTTPAEALLGYLRWPALFLLMIVSLAVLYRYGPSRRRAKWRWLTVGSVFAALAWLAMSAVFSWYLGNFANYNATYGALGAVIGMMMWMWLSTVVVLTGAELNAEVEHQTARDTTVGLARPLGMRGAVMADTVGVAAE
jgi:membrane protein